MHNHPIAKLLHQAGTAINHEDFDALLNIYTEDAVVVIKPGLNATGKAQIRQAFEAIAGYFNHTLKINQSGMHILETGDVALVMARANVTADIIDNLERHASYVFKKNPHGEWRCAVDNSYGFDVLQRAF